MVNYPAVPAVAAYTFVAKACLTDKREDADVSLRATASAPNKGSSPGGLGWCVWITTCDKAEMIIFIDSDARQTFYRSRSPGACE